MFPSFESKSVSRLSVFRGSDGKYYVIDSHTKVRGFSLLTMEEIDIKAFALTGRKIDVTGTHFLEGSGFGGGPFFREEFYIRHDNGIFYTEWEPE